MTLIVAYGHLLVNFPVIQFTQTDTHLATIVELSAYLHVLCFLASRYLMQRFYFFIYFGGGGGVHINKILNTYKYFCQILRSFNDPLPIFLYQISQCFVKQFVRTY